MLENITVNGVPLKEVVAAQIAEEIKQERNDTTIRLRWHRPTTSRNGNRNMSRSRSGRVRIIMQNGVAL